MSLALLQRALQGRRHHLSPFLMLGDPDAELCEELASAAVRHGATMLELGIPYDDPCADGPAIQKACLRARRAGMTTDGALGLLARLRARLPETPFNLLVYANLVHARGWERFCRDAAAAGASSLLCPDVPLEEDSELRAACAAAGLGHVYLVGPLTEAERLAEADRRQSAFLYLAAHQGVTGAPAEAEAAREALVGRVAAAVSAPLCVGFGLSRPAEVAAVFRAGARVAVVGSHLAGVIEGAADAEGRRARDRTVERFVDALFPLTRVQASPTSTES